MPNIRLMEELLAINDIEIEDVFDYHFYVNDEELTLLIEKPDGEQWELEIEKDYEDDLGIVFEQGLMDEYRSCRNKCIFCFIDQMPKGMRDTLYLFNQMSISHFQPLLYPYEYIISYPQCTGGRTIGKETIR